MSPDAAEGFETWQSADPPKLMSTQNWKAPLARRRLRPARREGEFKHVSPRWLRGQRVAPCAPSAFASQARDYDWTSSASYTLSRNAGFLSPVLHRLEAAATLVGSVAEVFNPNSGDIHHP